MFGIDVSEIVVILTIALVVLGPQKLPGAVRSIGHWVGRARAMASQLRRQLEQEVSALPVEVQPVQPPEEPPGKG